MYQITLFRDKKFKNGRDTSLRTLLPSAAAAPRSSCSIDNRPHPLSKILDPILDPPLLFTVALSQYYSVEKLQ